MTHPSVGPSMQFGDRIPILKDILRDYLPSIGIFREYLQNSDDAGASKQIFVLDHRRHGAKNLYDPIKQRVSESVLMTMQGPALLAYNNALFKESDWKALSTSHSSSKSEEIRKIGTFGKGFRSSYHYTDIPQILSGPSLCLFDPLRSFSDAGGCRLEFAQDANALADHLSGFDFFVEDSTRDFDGSVFRLPLRSSASELSAKPISPEEARQFLLDFIREELHICLLFLEHVDTVEVHEILADGTKIRLASSRKVLCTTEGLSFMEGFPVHTAPSAYNIEIRSMPPGHLAASVDIWQIQRILFSQEDVISRLNGIIGGDVSKTVQQNKLVPDVSIAIPIIAPPSPMQGRLYTYLPLPVKTGLPAHIHSRFALTSSRQHLVNADEVGVARGTDASVFVEWNKLLFERYIPLTWALLVRNLLHRSADADLFRAWPLSVISGPWNNLSAHLFDAFKETNDPIWPIISLSRTSKMHSDFTSIIFASPNDTDELLRALASFGLSICQAPKEIFDLALGSKCRILTPDIAYEALLVSREHQTLLNEPAPRRSIVLQYLISQGNIKNLARLPIFTLKSGEHVSLESSESTSTRFTLMQEAECTLFGHLDPNTLSLAQLDKPLSEFLIAKGPSFLNVCLIDAEKVRDYLYSEERLTVGNTERSLIDWLSAFWDWASQWASRDRLLGYIGSINLLSTGRGLTAWSSQVFIADTPDPSLSSSLENLGLRFLPDKFPPQIEARRYLINAKSFFSIQDLHALLDSVVPQFIDHLNDSDARYVLKHLACCAPSSVGRKGPLNAQQLKILHSLPIFPILKAGAIRTTVVRTCLLEGQDIIGIYAKGFNVIPTISGSMFLDLSQVEADILRLFDRKGKVMSDIDLLRVSVDNIRDQTLGIQEAILRHIAGSKGSVPPELLDHLESTPFIIATDGSTELEPRNTVNPDSEIDCLYPDNWLRPATSNGDQREIIRHLADLNLIRSSLTREIVRERIIHISHQSDFRAATTLASNLITLLKGQEHLFPDSDIAPTLSWLPTNRGLRGSGQCRDSDCLEDLFDEIMPVLNYDIRLSLPLREKLGWYKPFPLADLVEQVARIIAKPSPIPTLKIISVVKELAKRKQSLTEQDHSYIHNVLGRHAWIPVVGNGVATVQSTVLVDPLPGFYLIHGDLSGEFQFLLTLGCAERPTFDTILTMMQSREQALSTSDMIALLRRLVDIGIPDGRREELLIPDKGGKLCKFSNIYFDANNGSSPNLCAAHLDIDQDLAAKLSLKRPALSYDMPQMDQLDMGEPLERKIRRELLQYTPNQFITEFIANAIDAGAKKIRFLLDHAFHFNAERLLSSTLQGYNTCPSIVVYNDSIFKDEDFRGICNTGLGGKHERSDTIGLYGSGALTMFHFTEFVTIVSGEYVLFIDPMKNILPGSTRVAKARLRMINSQYPDQLRPLHGLYGFDASLDHFPGTIFRLPLRKSTHTQNRNNLYSTLWSPANVQPVIEAFRASISEFCLFTGIDAIGIDSRHGELNQTTFAVERNLEIDGSIRTELVTIPRVNQKWLVVSSCTADKCADVSQEFNRRYRPRSPIRAGIAANITDTRNVPNRPQSFKFFSTLPLALENHLPVHINAPFVLSSDRRQIRFDEYENSERKYNSWLLSKILPPLYIALLERLIPHRGDNALWWPADHTHHLSSVLVRQFYQQLAGNRTPLLYSKYGEPLSPVAAYITKPREPGVKVAKEFLSNMHCKQYVPLPSRVRNCLIELSKLSAVGPEHLRRVILSDPGRIAQIFDCNRPEGRKGLQELVAFISRNSPEDLIDLPLIPLVNGQLAEYRKLSASEQSYYVYDDWVRLAELFDNAYLVNPKYNVDGRLLETKAGLNIRRFDGPALEALLTNHLERSPAAGGVSLDKQKWIDLFWSLCRSFPFDASGYIRSFPLVQTARGSRYLSLEQCEWDSVVLLDETQPAFMARCLVMQDLDVVAKSNFDNHHSCRELLGRYPMFSLDRLLSALARPPGIDGRFAKLDQRLRDQFAEWARPKVQHVSKEKMHLARQMPIWPSLSRTKQTITLRAAQEVQMLPFNVDEEVIRQFLMEPTSIHQFSLGHLQVQPMGFSTLFSRLWLPRILSQAQMRTYKDLLLLVQPGHSVQNLQVPNGNRVMRPLKELYARDRLFLDAFERDRADKFVNDSYADIERHLKNLGLQDQSNLDFDMFKACAEAISREASARNETELIKRAESIFQVCADDLPVREDRSWRWRELDNVRFIPINTSYRRSTLRHLDVSRVVRPVESIATPGEVVIAKYEAIAWTQRALLRSSPSSKIQIVYDNFGCPDWTEVVEHLLAFSRLAQTHDGEAAILDDLKETYQWLENHFRDHEGAEMLRHVSEQVFLNVDDPSGSGGWTWHSASQLLLGMGEARNGCYPVARFLLSYPNLLHAAGVEKVNRNVQRTGDLEPALQNGREVVQNRLVDMRRNWRLTDVVFDTRDGKVPAHRVLLQASIGHFADWADFNESTTSTATPARVEMEDYSHETIGLALDFAYTGNWESRQEVDYHLLIEMLELADFWDWNALSSTAQSMLIEKVDLFTFREIRDAAEAHHATELGQACIDFELNNINLIERFGL